MKKRKGAFDVRKKVMPWLLALSLLMTISPVAAFATAGEGTESDDSTIPEAAIYLDQQHGADENGGLSKTTAVETIEKANALANEKNIKKYLPFKFLQGHGDRSLGPWRKDTAPLWARRLYDRTRRCVRLADTEQHCD